MRQPAAYVPLVGARGGKPAEPGSRNRDGGSQVILVAYRVDRRAISPQPLRDARCHSWSRKPMSDCCSNKSCELEALRHRQAAMLKVVLGINAAMFGRVAGGPGGGLV